MKSPSLLAGAILLAAGPLMAGVVPGRWEKVAALPAGKPIVVTLKAGERIECSFESLAPDALSISDFGGNRRKLPRSEVRRIVAAEKHDDRVRDGAIVGAVTGLAGGLAVGSAIYFGQGSEKEKPEAAGFILPFGPFGAGVGALVGYLADRSHRGHEVLYEAAARN